MGRVTERIRKVVSYVQRLFPHPVRCSLPFVGDTFRSDMYTKLSYAAWPVHGIFGFTLLCIPALAEAQQPTRVPTLYINAQRTANVLPVSTYVTPVSNLEFEPRVDLQSRNMAEAQGDVSIRGGIFENTGFRVGSATLVDPQTGHYSAELPIAPEMLTRPKVLTGAENGLYGFNSTAGTVSYGWTQIETGGSVGGGVGDHNLNLQRLHTAWSTRANRPRGWSLGVETEASRSESDGTIRLGDHDFERYSGRVQINGPNAQANLLAGYQSKRFGWPELYAAPFGFNETENLNTRLILLDFRQDRGVGSFWQVTAYYRRHNDHYILSRETPSIFEAFHETDVYALAWSGRHGSTSGLALNYSGQITSDEIESTALENNFTSRSQYKLSILPEYRVPLQDGKSLAVRLGASLDETNRDDSRISPLLDVTWTKRHTDGSSERLYISYAESSQVAGYTAIGGSETGGLFRSNHSLDRETSRNVEVGAVLDQGEWSLEGAIFFRQDDNLVDWTFSEASTSARSASNVDIETLGVEALATRRWGNLEALISYSFLGKNGDYGDTGIDASFYALNFPTHRATLGAIWRPLSLLELRVDNEARSQETNVLRTGDDGAVFTRAGVSVFPSAEAGIELHFAVDNAWDDRFQDVPGTPGRGDQYSASLTWRW